MQDYLLWSSQLIGSMAAEESISDIATADLQLAQHQQLWAEIETREETYQQAVDMGEELQTQDRSNRKEVRRDRKEVRVDVKNMRRDRKMMSDRAFRKRVWRDWKEVRRDIKEMMTDRKEMRSDGKGRARKR